MSKNKKILFSVLVITIAFTLNNLSLIKIDGEKYYVFSSFVTCTFNDDNVKQLNKMLNLERITLINHDLDNNLGDIKKLKHKNRVKYLTVVSFGICDSEIFQDFENLEMLEIMNNTGTLKLEGISKLKHLKYLTLTGKIDKQYLSELNDLDTLEQLNIYDSDISSIEELGITIPNCSKTIKNT